MFLLAVIVLISSINGLDGMIYKDWLPVPFEECLRTQCRGLSPTEIPPFSVLYYCLNYQLSLLNVDKEMLGPITKDDENFYGGLGRQLKYLLYQSKRKKRSGFHEMSRREIRTFSAKEKKKFFKAMNDLKKSGRYDAIAKLHQKEAIPGGHFGMGFAPWHRCYLLVLQLAIWEIDTEVTIPFCDITLERHMPDNNGLDSKLFSKHYYGTTDGQVMNGFCKNWPTSANVVLQRQGGGGAFFSYKQFLYAFKNFTSSNDFYVKLSKHNIEGLHNWVHLHIGGLMADLNHAPADPFFFCYHAFMDYLWELILQKQRGIGINPWFNTDNPNQQWNSTVAMLAKHLKTPLTLIHLVHPYFSSIVKYDHSHSKYPDCSNYPDILADKKNKICCARAKSAFEKNEEKLFKQMRSTNYKKFVVKNAFKPMVKRRKRSTKGSSDEGELSYITPMDTGFQNDFILNGVVSEKKWCYSPVRLVYERNPDLHFIIDTAKYQRVMEEKAQHVHEERLGRDDDDLFSAHRYPKLWKKLKSGHPDTFTKPRVQKSGAYKIMLESNGFSYSGKNTYEAIVDERQPVAETVGYVAVKCPSGGETVKTFVTAFDPSGAVCEARCHVHGSNPPKYERCSGVININDKEPKMYGNTLGDAYLLRYNFQGDNLPISHDGNIFLMFYCNYRNEFPWEKAYKKK